MGSLNFVTVILKIVTQMAMEGSTDRGGVETPELFVVSI